MRGSAIAVTGLLVGLATQSNAQSVCDAVLAAGLTNYTEVKVAQDLVSHMHLHMCAINWTDVTTMKGRASSYGIDFDIFQIAVGGTAGWADNASSRSIYYSEFCQSSAAFASNRNSYEARLVDNKAAVDAWSKCMSSRGLIAGLAYQEPDRKGVIIRLQNYSSAVTPLSGLAAVGPGIAAGDVKCDTPTPAAGIKEYLMSCSKNPETNPLVSISSSWGTFGPWTLEGTQSSYESLLGKIASHEGMLKNSFSNVGMVFATDTNADGLSEPHANCPDGWEPIDVRCTPNALPGWNVSAPTRRDNGWECQFRNDGSGREDIITSTVAVCGQRAMK